MSATGSETEGGHRRVSMSADGTASSAAQRYERDVVPFALPFARSIIDAAQWRGVRRVLDHGAGTGLMTRLVHQAAPLATVTMLDPSEAFLSVAPAESWTCRCVGAADDLASDTGRFDITVSNLVLMFCDTQSTLRRLAQVSDRLLMTVLGTAVSVQPFWHFWTAVQRVVPEAWSPERYPHHRLAEPSVLRQLADDAGFDDITVTAVRSGQRTIAATDAWRWLSQSMPIGRGDGYTSLPEEVMLEIESTFRDAWPGVAEWSGWRLDASSALGSG